MPRPWPRDFGDDPRICIPKVYWEYSAPRTLTLEDVGFIKIGDPEAIAASGISRVRVADQLYNLYMQQVFETFFVHVDPHPGNLFVRPLPCEEEIAAGITGFGPGQPVPHVPDRPFQIVFIDFGMVVPIPDRLRDALREYAVGLGTRDAHRIVQAYVNAGTLLPGADLRRLEEIHEALFERFWGIQVGQLRDTALREARYFMREYRDVIREAPFQFQVDMLFVVRAIGILSGMAANLDPGFDVWSKTLPYARRYASEALRKDCLEWVRFLAEPLLSMFRLPEELERVVRQTGRGNFVTQASLAPDARKAAERLNRGVDRLADTVLTASLIISAALLYAAQPDGRAWMTAAALAVWAFMRTGGR